MQHDSSLDRAHAPPPFSLMCEAAARDKVEELLLKARRWGWLSEHSWEVVGESCHCTWVAMPGHAAQVQWFVGSLDPNLVPAKERREKVSVVRPDPALIPLLSLGTEGKNVAAQHFWKRRIAKVDRAAANVPGVSRALFDENGPLVRVSSEDGSLEAQGAAKRFRGCPPEGPGHDGPSPHAAAPINLGC
uniref:Uncharacterized protein n=1 Tax=Hemiselmis tepida TaxID=464990 RepID=A0A6T6T9A8_9CRYP